MVVSTFFFAFLLPIIHIGAMVSGVVSKITKGKTVSTLCFSGKGHGERQDGGLKKRTAMLHRIASRNQTLIT